MNDDAAENLAPGEPIRVLVIEDERLAQDALRVILELDGYQVRAAGDGRRAVRVLRTFNPHVVIMDWCLPGLSGQQLCDEVRRRCPGVPIIIVSSSDDAFARGVNVSARLRKPLDVRRLRSIVAARAARARQASPPESAVL